MSAIRITTKRQATLPKALCDEMALRPGDTVIVKKKVIAGKPFWCLTPAERPSGSWFGSLRKYARGKRHDMATIRKHIAKARKHGLD